jgi:integrase
LKTGGATGPLPPPPLFIRYLQDCELEFGYELPGAELSPTTDSEIFAQDLRQLIEALFAAVFDPGHIIELSRNDLLLTGAREGELLALRWTDLELPKEGAGKMVIRRSLSWARPQVEEVRPRHFPPKTKAGRRTISIPALLVAELKRWKLQCPISDDGLVFPTADGKPMPRAKMLQTQFYPALSRAKLRRVTFHTLRHSCASAMIASGSDH